mmetsp:Transcript_124742/g.216260  ORF Transcript_124742/g.216260 Transcript_124742/m.216260 type:complete len:215 (+) Transcript_124742:1009-1653(+)
MRSGAPFPSASASSACSVVPSPASFCSAGFAPSASAEADVACACPEGCDELSSVWGTSASCGSALSLVIELPLAGLSAASVFFAELSASSAASHWRMASASDSEEADAFPLALALVELLLDPRGVEIRPPTGSTPALPALLPLAAAPPPNSPSAAKMSPRFWRLAAGCEGIALPPSPQKLPRPPSPRAPRPFRMADEAGALCRGAVLMMLECST